MVAGAETTASPDDRDVCWCWAGSFQAPRVRHRAYTHEGEHEIFRHTSGCNVRERGTPMIHSPEVGYAVAAHRHLYALWTDVPLRGVPRLQRCHDDRCVRPSHTQELDAVPERARGRSRGGVPVGEPEDLPPPTTDVWEALTHPETGPSPQLEDKHEAEAEIGMPISKTMWNRFRKWAREQPDD